MAKIIDLVRQFGDDAIDHIYLEIDRRVADFRGWLARRPNLADIERDIHLANAHLFLEFLAEDSPCFFPEELVDDDDTQKQIDEETSTTFGFRQFVYLTYIRKGPGVEKLTGNLLASLELYFQYLIDARDISALPRVAHDAIHDEDIYFRRLREYREFQEQFEEDTPGWIAAFDAWEDEFYSTGGRCRQAS